ncbi:MAG: DUF58 domain-containing protein [Phycisphaerales bacterium]|nr:DUF58 domain-containing protein [Phycisphaerales bacterium]
MTRPTPGRTGIGSRVSGGLFALIIATVVVCVIGSALHPRTLLLLPSLIVVLVAGIAWPWLTVFGLRGVLRFETDRVHEQEQLAAHLLMRQISLFPAWGVVMEAGLADSRRLPTLFPLKTTTLKLLFVPPHRGEFPLTKPRVLTGFPFGLLTAGKAIRVASPLIVWPRVFPVAPPPDWARTDMATGHIDTRRAGTDGETCGVRAYRRGDPMRWIHWPQTARHDRMIVREFQATATPRMLIILDCNIDAHVGMGTDCSFEWAVRITASLAVGWLDCGAEVEIQAGPLRISVAGGTHQRKSILDTLARVSLCESDVAPLNPPRDTSLVFISTDLGWRGLPQGRSRWWRGFSLANKGFGGDRPMPPIYGDRVVTVESPLDVPSALMGVKRGLIDVA